jgi:cellulose synthase/poly-beta-1,6-N-acetylglucosamine synthase-like glycosyltransferase
MEDEKICKRVNLLDSEEKNNIKFSVIVPVFNVEVYLKDCLDSILQQGNAYGKE